MYCVGMTLGKKIALARTQKSWSQEDLAEAMGVEVPTVSRWENDLIRPRARRMAKLSEKLGRSTEWFHSGENNELAAMERRLQALEKRQTIVPKILLSVWPGATADAKAVCLWVLTRRKEYYDFLPHETQSALQVLDRALGTLPPKPVK